MFEKRLARLRTILAAAELDAVAINASHTLTYLTGLSFHLMERPVVGLFHTDRNPILVLPELELAKLKASSLEVQSFPYGEDPGTWQQAFQDAWQALDVDAGPVGYDPLTLRMLEYGLLNAVAPGTEFVPAGGELAQLRIIKDQTELAAIRRAVEIAESALTATTRHIRLDMSERELAAELTLQLLQHGSDTELPFQPIVASGPNSAIPHATPTPRRLSAGDLLILDWGARVDGYISDITRTFAVGEVDVELEHIHQVVLDSNTSGRKAVQPGVPCGEIDQAARRVIQQAGFGELFTHRTGHGIGLEAHEAPSIRAGESLELAPGMTFTVEPGIYLPGRGGVRIEDNVLVTPKGARSLTTLRRDLVRLA
jgi:Xaa-Pro dipeptidase